jgi:hypothetical protein
VPVSRVQDSHKWIAPVRAKSTSPLCIVSNGELDVNVSR